VSRRDEIWQRLLEKRIVQDGPLDTSCWIWTGGTSGVVGKASGGGGYGRISINSQTSAVHRVAYTHAHGFIPRRRVVDHLCNNRLCFNPDHLELITQRRNCKRRDERRSLDGDSGEDYNNRVEKSADQRALGPQRAATGPHQEEIGPK
jgi:hypothetical protein